MTTLTPNLKLRISDDLTADSIYNLNRIDNIGAANKVENNGNLRIRALNDIILSPESQDLGGESGGTVSIGEDDVSVDLFDIFADLVNFNDSPALIREIRFPELLINGSNYVGFAPPDDISSNVLWKLPNIDGAANQVIKTDGSGNLGWASVLTDSLAENNINIGNPFDMSQAVDTSLLGDILADVSTGLTIKAAKITNAHISSIAGIALTKLAATTMNHALATDSSGFIVPSTVTADELDFLSGTSSNLQVQLDNKQPLDNTLTALSGFNVNGFLVQTSADTFTGRSLQAGAGISILNGDAVTGDPTISSTISQYTDELAQDAVGTILIDSNSIDFTYNDGLPSITADLRLSAASADAGQFNAIASIETDGLQVQVANSSITALIDAYKVTASWTSGTSKTVTHSLGTTDVSYNIYDIDSGEELWPDTAIRTSINAIAFTATQAPTGSGWKVIIRK